MESCNDVICHIIFNVGKVIIRNILLLFRY